MKYMRVLIILVAALLVLLIGRTYMQSGMDMADINGLFAMPWVRVMVLDSVLAMLCFAMLIFHFEASKQTALLWTLGIIVFGNLASALWILLRFLPRFSR